uniref:Solute carrier family 26 member 6-like n=1 Tax=Sinocyclocheilus rhinocerous TaxID=307959 RepID=A0A673KE77_9TELE
MGVSDHAGATVCVERIILDELKLDEFYSINTFYKALYSFTACSRCSVGQWKIWILKWIPLLSWIPQYSVRENGLGDLVSGVSVGIMHLPQGWFTSCVCVCYAIFFTCIIMYNVIVIHSLHSMKTDLRSLNVPGTFAVISIMIGSVSERLAPDDHFLTNGTNGSVVMDTEARDVQRVKVAAATTLLCGIFQVLLGLVRFGFVVTYLSEPLVRGYTTGAATHVITSQLKYMFGVSPRRFSGPLQLIYTLVELGRLLPQTHIATLLISLVALTALIIVKEINSCYSHRLLLPVPIELMVVSTVNGVDVVGEIPSGLVPPRVPEVGFFSSVVGDAFAVAVVGYAISISLGKTFALKHGYKVDSNQELVALGLSNTIGGFFQCYSVTSSMSRSLVQESTGGKTQFVSSSCVCVSVITHQAVLSSIVFVNLKGMFMQCQDIPALWRSSRVDLLVWLVTFLCTVLLNLDLGLAASIIFTLLTVICRTQLPYRQTVHLPIPGITIFRSSAMIYYANAELYQEALLKKSGINVPKLLKLKTRKEEENAKKKQVKEQDKQPEQDSEEENRDETDTHSSSCDGVQEHTHSIILDFSPVSFIDTVTLKTLKNVSQVTFILCVVQQLERGGFFSESISKSRLFPSIHDAVLHCLCRSQRDRSGSEFALTY